MVTHTIQEYVELLSDERFKDVDYMVIKAHVSFLHDITFNQLMTAIKKHKEATPEHAYSRPNLKHVVPYLYIAEEENGDTTNKNHIESAKFSGDMKVMRRKRQRSVQAMRRDRTQKTTVFDLAKVDEREVYEERLIFLKILRSSYYKQIGEHNIFHRQIVKYMNLSEYTLFVPLTEHGELESRGFISHSLFQSLDVEEDRAVRGLSLNDWEGLQVVSASLARPAEYLRKRTFEIKERLLGGKMVPWGMEFFLVSLQVRQALGASFVHRTECYI